MSEEKCFFNSDNQKILEMETKLIGDNSKNKTHI